MLTPKKRFELFNELLFHFWAFFDFCAGVAPVSGAASVTGLFANVLVYDFVDFAFVLVCDLHVGFF